MNRALTSVRGIYDEDFIEFTIKVLRKAGEYGLYVFMDPHQDVVCCLQM
jgi:hypothetical protein